ncbi:MAG: hypothetical protein LBT59_11200, partial [Clostridiales bacterium]|nr:hypothetical protein [Clostridiales bacterium]
MKLKKGVYGAMILAVALLVSAIPFFASAAQNDNDGYTIINTAAELDAIRNDLSGKYRLYSDIDLSGYTSETNTAANGWKPIAFYSSFRGELDGNGHTISGLWSMWGIENVGLFSGLSGASIHDLGIEIADAGLTGASEVGALAGFAMDGSIIENVSVHGGRIAATEGENAGGIAGVAYGSAAIRNCLVEGTETKASGSYSGALAGSLDEGSAIESSRAEGTFSEGVFYVGGLVGALKGGAKITGSFSSGEAVASAAYAGGLAGIVGEKSSIIESEATGNASANSSVGGLAGIVSGGSKLEKVGASGDATAFSGEKTGGLVGQLADSTIKNSYAHGNVKGATRIGGLVGSFSGTGSKSAAAASVENSYSTGIVTGIGATDYGAFNGRSDVKYLGTNYYDGDTASAPRAYGTGGSPSGDASAFPKSLTTAQLKSQSSYQGWDFAKVWTIDEGASYPYFRHSAPAPSPAPTATPIPPTPSPISLPTSAPTVIPFKTASPKPATTTPVPTSAPIRTATPRPTATGAPLKLITPTPNALSLDSDNDGLPDKVEISIGTDPFNKDTDGDGLSDGDEVNVYGTNPLKEDTDDDGLPDNVEIYDLLTDPLSEDSDGDGRTDVDEITNIRRSDPMVWDTDGDGARDGWEIENGYDPKKFNDLFKDSVETERIFDEEGHWYTIKATYEVPGRYAGKGKIARPKVTFNTLDTAGYMFPAIKLALDGNNNDNDTAYTDITYKIVFEQNIYKNVEARGYETLMGGPSSVPKTAKIDKESGFMEVTQKYRGGIFILNLNKKDDNIPSSTPMPTATPKPTNTPTRTAPPKPTTPIPTRTDSDNDGLLDSLEYYAHRTDLDNWDTDGDGL